MEYLTIDINILSRKNILLRIKSYHGNMEMKSRSLIDLPPEIVLVILEYLSDQDVFILGLVCYKLHEITSSYLQLGKNYCPTIEYSSYKKHKIDTYE